MCETVGRSPLPIVIQMIRPKHNLLNRRVKQIDTASGNIYIIYGDANKPTKYMRFLYTHPPNGVMLLHSSTLLGRLTRFSIVNQPHYSYSLINCCRPNTFSSIDTGAHKYIAHIQSHTQPNFRSTHNIKEIKSLSFRLANCRRVTPWTSTERES